MKKPIFENEQEAISFFNTAVGMPVFETFMKRKESNLRMLKDYGYIKKSSGEESLEKAKGIIRDQENSKWDQGFYLANQAIIDIFENKIDILIKAIKHLLDGGK